MNSPGRIKGRTPASLKDAYSQLVDACGGDVPAANIAQKSKSQIQRYTDESDPDCHMPLTVVLALEAACGDPFVSRFLAMQTQNVLVDVSGGTSGTPTQHMAVIGRDTGKLYQEFGESLADGTITTKDAAKLKAAAMKDIAALAALIGDLNKVQGGQP